MCGRLRDGDEPGEATITVIINGLLVDDMSTLPEDNVYVTLGT